MLVLRVGIRGGERLVGRRPLIVEALLLVLNADQTAKQVGAQRIGFAHVAPDIADGLPIVRLALLGSEQPSALKVEAEFQVAQSPSFLFVCR